MVVIGLAGVAVRAPLAQVPENSMKFVVGIMLTTFGTFWGAEGAGARGRARTRRCSFGPGMAAVSLGCAAWLRRAHRLSAAVGGAEPQAAGRRRKG